MVNKWKVPVLTYHSIDDSGSVISTAPTKFREQMNHLSKSGSRVITLEEIIRCIRHNQPFPSGAVAITFDDGFKNVYDVAYPILAEFGFQATVFLVPGFCGRNNRWNKEAERIPILDLLDWDPIVEMADNGIDFGAHTMTHPNLSKVSLERAIKEIGDSKTIIEKNLRKKVGFFAYPYGQQTEAIQDFVSCQFDAACSTQLDCVNLQSKLYSLPRIEMYYFSKNNLFTLFGTPFFLSYIQLRRMLRLLRTWGRQPINSEA